MPFIQVNVSRALQGQQKEELKAKLGEVITLIPGKTETVTMIDIADNRTIYKAGKPINGGFIEVRLYGTAEQTSKEALTEAIFATAEQLLGIQPQDLYLNIIELNSWGANGRLK
jgi:phenylpyruvate tautomerase PptA (4-oxalocrotonate tautomerase family)